MGTKNSRSGGKFGGTHTTFIDAATVLVDIADVRSEVHNISSGYIKSGLPSANGQRRVKILDIQGGVFLKIRGNTTYQEVRVFSHNVQQTKLSLAKVARDRGFHISFKQ